jgi:hypothetical protein
MLVSFILVIGGIGIYTLLFFIIFAVVLSCFGIFSILEIENGNTGIGIFKAIVGFVICAIASIGVGFVLYQEKLKEINLALLGSISGFLLGLLLYSVYCAVFITSSSILLWFILIISTVIGIVIMFVDNNDFEPVASILIGAYMIIRGLSFIYGGYPNEVEVLAQLIHETHQISGLVSLYLMHFLSLFFTGLYVQAKNNSIENFRNQWL